jgi:hypothetical protein
MIFSDASVLRGASSDVGAGNTLVINVSSRNAGGIGNAQNTIPSSTITIKKLKNEVYSFILVFWNKLLFACTVFLLSGYVESLEYRHCKSKWRGF